VKADARFGRLASFLPLPLGQPTRTAFAPRMPAQKLLHRIPGIGMPAATASGAAHRGFAYSSLSITIVTDLRSADEPFTVILLTECRELNVFTNTMH
jgi:hypothetical protein